MDGRGPGGCPHCAELQKEIASLHATISALTARQEKLEAELARSKKNSSTSSKPPSSDIVKPPKTAPQGKTKRKQGAQLGHARHERPLFSPEEVDKAWDYHLGVCPDCGGRVEPSDQPPRIIQQVEIIPRPIEISEHRGLACYCPRCQKTHFAPIDEPVIRSGLVGPRLSALVAYLKGVCHCSFSTIRKFLRDVACVTISRGQLAKLIGKVTKSMKVTYELLLGMLPSEPLLNVDETGHKDCGQPMWTWCFRATLFTLFKIAPSRGSAVLVEVLGREFDGVLGCDYFSAYRKYMRECGVLVQFCLAHLIRDLKFLADHPKLENQSYGRRVLEAARRLFQVIHRREAMKPETFAATLEMAGKALCRTAVRDVPPTSEAANLARRFKKHGTSYIRFITTPGIEPTNNLAEQAIRFVVIDRRVTQGSRSETGQRWLERIWTIVATCTQQGRSVFAFLLEAIRADFSAEPAPTLVPNTS
jgi:transposase